QILIIISHQGLDILPKDFMRSETLVQEYYVARHWVNYVRKSIHNTYQRYTPDREAGFFQKETRLSLLFRRRVKQLT
ncbi:MAG: hypothetical protein QMC95_15410, partial [Desulfitobacteriaceae bacterium]|nr:hypothetical protein [Desulfitobacteriaceae bacterium]MDI6881070.1 hypothetical protein [Desulfitobacteriaceae bacterium]MDI6915580.1 hypothetical protein [Desulfitobacteriaceae bacterium]